MPLQFYVVYPTTLQIADELNNQGIIRQKLKIRTIILRIWFKKLRMFAF